MLKVLEPIDSKQAESALSSLTRALLTTPTEENIEQRLQSLPELQRKILDELSERLQLTGPIPSEKELPAVLDSLSRELSEAVLSKANIDELEARTFQKEPDIIAHREPRKPGVFISCSAEGLPFAQALQRELTYFTSVTLWTESSFQTGGSTLETLLRSVSTFDFAVFVLSPGDLPESHMRS